MQLYSTLVLPMIKESLQNFIDTEIYLCRYEIDYLEKEELYLNSKCLWVWEQIETSKWKLVKIERIWEINSIWTFDVENNQEIIISGIKMIKWETWDKFESRLNESIKTQYNIFHSDLTSVKKWKWIFIEVKKSNINNYNTDCYYKKEQIYSLALHFDDNWVLFKKESVKYFQIFDNTYFDLEDLSFKQWNQQILIQDEREKLFMKYLVDNFPKTLKKEDLIEFIYSDIIKIRYKNKWDKTDVNYMNNFYLLPLKRKFIDKYPNTLWIDKDIFTDKILIAPKNKGYSIKWKFVTEI